LKGHFARYGCPEQVVSDNGPQYISTEFSKFSLEWNFEHCPSSSGHSQINGKAESAVKSTKRMMRNAKEAGSDPYMALLDIRNTPTYDTGTSPVQKLMLRRTRTLIPTTQELLRPKMVDGKKTRDGIRQGQKRQAKYYDRKAKDLPELEEGDTVRLKPFVKGEREWRSGTVARRLDERSYEVTTHEGTSYRRNRAHLRKTGEPPTPFKPVTDIQRQAQHNEAYQSSPICKDPSSPMCQDPRTPTTQDLTAPMSNVPSSPMPTQPAVSRQQKSRPNNVEAKPGISPTKGRFTRSGRAIKLPSRLLD